MTSRGPDLRQRRRSTLAYTVGFAGYAILVVALYPNFRHDQALAELTQGNDKLSALFGATGSLTSPEGWMNANLYANLVPLFALLMTIGFGAATVAGQDEEGTLGTWVSQPVTRRRVLAQKLVALGLLALPVPLVTLGAAVLGPRFQLDLAPLGGLLGITAGTVLLALDIGLLAVAVGCWTGSRGAALGTAAAYAAFAYVVSSLAPVVDWIHGLRWTSLFWWSVGSEQLSAGLHVTNLAVLLCAGAALVVAASVGFTRLDIH